jgi:hypothetical protein
MSWPIFTKANQLIGGNTLAFGSDFKGNAVATFMTAPMVHHYFADAV